MKRTGRWVNVLKISVVLSFVVLSATGRSHASGLSCDELFKAKIESSSSDQAWAAQALLARMFDGITERGFFATKPAPNLELTESLKKKGIMWWGLRIYIVNDLAAAKAHSAHEPNTLLQGVYLLRGHGNSMDLSDMMELPAPRVASSLLAGEGMYYIHNGQAEKIPAAFIKEHMSLNELTWNPADSEAGPFLYQTGWALPKQRGVILAENTIGSSTYSKLRRVARALVASGWRISFNEDFKKSLDLVAAQARKNGDNWVADSRYLDADTYNSALDSFNAGSGFSAEIRNEFGELVGGVIGTREGSVYSPDSVFYDQRRYPKLSISLAKIAFIAMFDRMIQAGIPFVDAGMVSQFTRDLKGELIPVAEFLARSEALPAESPVDFKTDWVP